MLSSSYIFANDLVILANTEACLQNQINIIMSGLKECGLNINHGKCATESNYTPYKKCGYAHLNP